MPALTSNTAPYSTPNHSPGVTDQPAGQCQGLRILNKTEARSTRGSPQEPPSQAPPPGPSSLAYTGQLPGQVEPLGDKSNLQLLFLRT